MAQVNIISGLAIEGLSIVPRGKQILWCSGQPVWCGNIGAPTEDVEFNRISVNPEDFEKVVAATKTAKGHGL